MHIMNHVGFRRSSSLSSQTAPRAGRGGLHRHRAFGLRLGLLALVFAGLLSTSDPAARTSVSALGATGTCGCTTQDSVSCLTLHDCTVPRYNCDHINGTRANNRISGSCTLFFPLTAGTHTLWDADGTVVATVSSSSVMINYGSRRTLNGVPMILAFSVPGTDGRHHSAWLPVGDIAEDMSWMPNLTPATPSAPQLEARPMHAVTNRAYYLTPDGSQSLKVTTDCANAGEWATDYLDKDNGRVTQVYNTPGWGAGSPTMDFVHVGTGKVFYRDANLAHVAVPLYNCQSGTARSTGKELWFLYGYIQGVSPARYGWMAYPIINF